MFFMQLIMDTANFLLISAKFQYQVTMIKRVPHTYLIVFFASFFFGIK